MKLGELLEEPHLLQCPRVLKTQSAEPIRRIGFIPLRVRARLPQRSISERSAVS